MCLEICVHFGNELLEVPTSYRMEQQISFVPVFHVA